jgi:hypothetical protein
MAEKALNEAGVNSDGSLIDPMEELKSDDDNFYLNLPEITAKAEKLGVTMYNYRDYESPGVTIRSSADGVRVKRQKPDRPMLDGAEKKRVYRAVIHTQTKEWTYN